MVIGFPPILNFGSPALKAKIVPEIMSGKKFISLAISEAFAGSDVAGLRCTATKSEDGTFWTINGTKKCVFLLFFSSLPAFLRPPVIYYFTDIVAPLSLLHC